MAEKLVKITKFTPVASSVAKNGEAHIVWGWASVVTEKGVPVVDAQGDEIPVDVMQKAVHEFVKASRVGKVMHAGEQAAEIVDTIFLTKALQDALGIDLQKEGWFVGYETADPEVWKRIDSGELRAFSIGGRCVYEETPPAS